MRIQEYITILRVIANLSKLSNLFMSELYLNFEESQLAELYKQVKLMSTTYTSGVLTLKPTTREGFAYNNYNNYVTIKENTVNHTFDHRNCAVPAYEKISMKNN